MAVALPVRPGPAALHPPPHLTNPASGYPEVAPAARPGRPAACPDTARTATATPTRTACALTALPEAFQAHSRPVSASNRREIAAHNQVIGGIKLR
jgi:hypothetical protein